MSAGAWAPPPGPTAPLPPSLPPVPHDIVDPADAAALAGLTDLLGQGQADLSGLDEADLALLPTLTRPGMRRGQQLQLPAPGTKEKRSVCAISDLGEGGLLWRTDARRCADQFCAPLTAGADRSSARGRLAGFLVDTAPSHRVGKTGIVRRGLDALAGRVVRIFLPSYRPDRQPPERLWRQWRPNVPHNHTRGQMAQLQADSDEWLARMAAQPKAVLQALALRDRAPARLAA